MRLFKILAIFILFGSLASCSCNFHMRKARGKCGYTSDTIYKNIEVLVPKVETDTVFNFFIQRDTVVLRDKNLTIKYFYNTHDSTVFVSGVCDTITITKRVPVIVNKYKMSLPFWVNWLKWILFILVAAITGVYAWSKLKPKITAQLNK